MDDLDRLFTRLVHNMRTDFPHLIGRQFQVSDIYQHIVPYRHNRRELGFETNADYEVALLRLLSGERGAMMGDAAMQDTIRRELAMPVPNTELYREFSDTMVSLAPDALARLGTPAPAVARAEATGSATTASAPAAREAEPVAPARQAAPPAPASPDVAPLAPSATARPAAAAPAAQVSALPASSSDVAPRRAPAERATTDRPMDRARASESMPAERESATSTLAGAESRASGVASSGAGRCRYCGGSLPDGRHVTFCPHCGQNLSVQQCPACGTELEIGWRFCVTCGREVG